MPNYKAVIERQILLVRKCAIENSRKNMHTDIEV